jgi:hypothetical protein
MQAVSGTARGKRATPAQRAQVLALLEELEALNAVASPARSPLLSGRWALLYQGGASGGRGGMAPRAAPPSTRPPRPAPPRPAHRRPATPPTAPPTPGRAAAPLTEAAARSAAATTEGPFLGALQPLAAGLVRTRANLQLIDLPASRVENCAQFEVAGRWEGSLNIIGTARVHEPEQVGGGRGVAPGRRCCCAAPCPADSSPPRRAPPAGFTGAVLMAGVAGPGGGAGGRAVRGV